MAKLNGELLNFTENIQLMVFAWKNLPDLKFLLTHFGTVVMTKS